MKVRKEILRVGDFKKESDGIEFSINEQFLDHLVNTFSEMKEDGVKVPVPLEHTDDPDKNRGWVDNLERDGESLYGEFELNGVEHPENMDVSVFIPPKHTSGNGKTYIRPIRHIALTSYPVVPGLDKFEAVAASLVLPKGDEPMAFDWKGLGTSLGISDEMTEENATDLLKGKFDTLNAELVEAKKPEKSSAEELREIAASHPGLIKLGKEGREAKIDSLMKTNRINKAVRDDLVSMFCSDDAIALSLDESETEFDKLVKVLEKNELVPVGEGSGPQTLRLSDPAKGGEDQSPLMADAERRKKA